MNMYQCEYLLIFLVCFRSLAAQGFKYVTRYENTQFGSLLCSPGAYINISGVYGCNRVKSHCRFNGSLCNVVFPEDREYYQLVVSKCNGRVACTDLNAGSYGTRNCNFYYTTIKYQCLPAKQDDQGAHYHRHAIQCLQSPFTDLTCPDNMYINVTEVYRGNRKSPSDYCTAQIDDCAKSYPDLLMQGMVICNGLAVCSGLTIYQNSNYPCQGSQRRTDYLLLFYQCLQNPSGVHYTCQSGITKTLNISEGTVVSPGYPGQYQNSIDCAFHINAPRNHIVQITFKMFHLKRYILSCDDYVEVFDGLDDQSSRLGWFCGDTLPDPITSTGNGLRIRFYSDRTVSARGFVFIWRSAIHYTCQSGITHNITDYEGTAVSPGYPGKYYHNTDCAFLIRAPSTYKVEITFQILDLEENEQCGHDYLDVYDGPDDQAPWLGRLCGDTLPEPITSTENSLLISFHSDYSRSAGGFVFVWRFIETAVHYTCQSGITHNITAHQGTAVSPGYPGQYYPNTDCAFFISARSTQKVEITFQMFDLEPNDQYGEDYLYVYDGPNDQAPWLGPLCGNTLPEQITSTGNSLLISFHSDRYRHYKGFVFNWRFIEMGDNYTCQSGFNQSITALQGTVVSPGYPGQYSHGTDCDVYISAPTNYMNYKVEITFQMFDLQPDDQCGKDYLYVYDGLNDQAPWLGPFCGNTLPDPITSTGNSLLISFQSDGYYHYRGFVLIWRFTEMGDNYTCQSGFNQNITAHQGTVVSPGYPGQYYHGTDCDVYISAQKNYKVEITFKMLDLEEDKDCEYDYLDVYDGPDDHTPQLGSFCGDTLPEQITSTWNSLLISFHSDHLESAAGFMFVWKFIKTAKPTTEYTTTVTTSGITTLDTTKPETTTPETTPPPTDSSKQPDQITQTVVPPVTDGKTSTESMNKDLVMYIVIAVAALAVIAIIISVTIIMVKSRKRPTTGSLHAGAVAYDNRQGQATIQHHSLSHTGRQTVENVYDFDNQELTSFGYSTAGHNNDIPPDYENTRIHTRDHDLPPSHHAFPETIYQNYNPRETNRQRAHVEVAPSGEVYSLVQKTAKRHTDDDYDLAQNTGSDYEYSLTGDAYNTGDKNEQEYGTVLVDNATYGST